MGPWPLQGSGALRAPSLKKRAGADHPDGPLLGWHSPWQHRWLAMKDCEPQRKVTGIAGAARSPKSVALAQGHGRSKGSWAWS